MNGFELLREWLDASEKQLKTASNSSGKAPTSKMPATSYEEVVYIWDMYLDQRDKGTWCSAEKQEDGKYEGYVYKTVNQAYHGATTHLYELENEGELRGDPIDYTVDIVDIPISEVGDYTLEFSGI